MFLELYQNSGQSGITFQDIRDYEDVKQFTFTQYEVKLLLNCKTWANKEIDELKKED